MSHSDHELMHRCRSGDADAFELLVRRWERPVARVLGRLVDNSSDVDDLCQETFLRVLQAQSTYRPRAAFSTWLYAIAMNVARDAARRRRHATQANNGRDVPTGEPAPVAGASRREIGREIQTALDKLPRHLREVLILKHFAELTFAEVADVLGLPVSTAKSRARAALEQVRRELKKHGISEGELSP